MLSASQKVGLQLELQTLFEYGFCVSFMRGYLSTEGGSLCGSKKLLLWNKAKDRKQEENEQSNKAMHITNNNNKES